MKPARPDVPRPAELKPLIETISVGTVLVRAYVRSRGPLGFNSSMAPGRFRPVLDGHGAVVATACMAMDAETALAEGLVRGVSALRQGDARRRLYRLELDDLGIATLRVRRPLRVVRLHGAGLTLLAVLREHLIDTPESDHGYTASWAKALHGTRVRPHGLAWTSRQNDSARALMLWHPRLPDGALEVDGPVIALDREPGLELVRTVCADAGVDFEG